MGLELSRLFLCLSAISVLILATPACHRSSPEAVIPSQTYDDEIENPNQDSSKSETDRRAASSKSTSIKELTPLEFMVDSWERAPLSISKSALKTHHNNDVTEGLLEFFERDFRTETFDSVVNTRAVELVETRPGLHIWSVEMSFVSPEHSERSASAVKVWGRQNFRIEVLTVFQLWRCDSILLMVFSETPYNPAVDEILAAHSDWQMPIGCDVVL